MSELNNILQKLKGTRESEILLHMDSAYENIKNKQDEWYKKAEFFCPDGCGECCRNFEPDLLECEALFMAAWLIENQPEVATQVAEGIFPYPDNKGCLFWNENAEYHCTIYGARPCVCRLFGACGNKAKNGETVLKPCKFYPAEKLAEYKKPLVHKQYSQAEVLEIFNTLPPVMSDLMENVVSINPENHETTVIQKILPDTIRRLMWISSMNNQ